MSIMIEAIDTNDEISSQLRDMMRRFRAFLRNLIKQGQATGAFRSDACPDEIAAAYTSSVLGAEAQFYQDPEAFVLRHTLKPAIERLMDYLQARPAQ